jgi:hypothetical protein
MYVYIYIYIYIYTHTQHVTQVGEAGKEGSTKWTKSEDKKERHKVSVTSKPSAAASQEEHVADPTPPQPRCQSVIITAQMHFCMSLTCTACTQTL